MEKRNVLVVNLDSDLFEKIQPLLNRVEFEVDRFPRAGMALELISQVPFDVLVVGYPVPDIATQELLDAVRASGSPCLRSPLLLLASQEQLAAAERFIGRGANRVVAIEESSENLQGEISKLLEVAPRSSLRVMVRVNVQVNEGRELAICQSANFSSTGMLIRAGQAYPIGARLSFEFQVGRDPVPICGEGEVVRHTTPGREAVHGMGVRFVSFERDGLPRLKRFLASQGLQLEY